MAQDRIELSKDAMALFHGSEQDKKELLQLHLDYLDANTNNLDEALLRQAWSADPACVFFNSTGYNYYGIEDWLKLWQHFRPRLENTEPRRSQDVRLIGNGQVASIVCVRTARITWKGDEETPPFANKLWRSRSTEVCMREGDKWKCVHVHISHLAEGARYEQRGP